MPGKPDLVPSQSNPGELIDSTKPDDGVDVKVYKGAKGSGRLGLVTVEYVIEKREFNRYKEEPVDLNTAADVETGAAREKDDGQGLCWKECQYVRENYHQERTLQMRYFEYWSVNVSLKAYYDFITGPKVGVPAGAVGVASVTGGDAAAGFIAGVVTKGAIGVATAPGAGAVMSEAVAAGASTGGLALGTFVTAFVTTTYVMKHFKSDSELISSGWELVEPLPAWSPKKVVARSTPAWKPCGPKHPCGQLIATAGPSQASVGLPALPVGSAPSTTGNLDLVPSQSNPGEFTDSTKPDDSVDVTVYKGSKTSRLWYSIEYFIEQREFNRYKEEPVELNTAADIETGATREVDDGRGTCWKECQYVRENYHQERTLRMRYVEYWSVNVSLQAYYDFITGEKVGVPAGAVGVTFTSAEGRSIAGKVGKKMARGAIGRSAPGSAGVVSQALTAVVTSKPALIATTFVTAYVASTYVVRHFDSESELISSGWELVEPLPSWSPAKVVARSTPAWKLCGPKHPCRQPTMTPVPTPSGVGSGAAGTSAGPPSVTPGDAPSGSAPSGTGPRGTAPSGNAPSGTTPSGTVPSGTPSGTPGSSPGTMPTGAPTGSSSGSATPTPTGSGTATPSSPPGGSPTGAPTGGSSGSAIPTTNGSGAATPTNAPTGSPTSTPTGSGAGSPTPKPAGLAPVAPPGTPPRTPTGGMDGTPSGTSLDVLNRPWLPKRLMVTLVALGGLAIATGALIYGGVIPIPSGSGVSGGSGQHADFYLSGTIVSRSGCAGEFFQAAPQIGETGALAGEMWLSSGVLSSTTTDGFEKYQGTLRRDGSFDLAWIHPNGDGERQSINGLIGSDGKRISGTWDSVFLSGCLLHVKITEGHFSHTFLDALHR